MGQCPVFIPGEGDGICYSKENNEATKEMLSEGVCFEQACNPVTVTNITLSKYDEHRFLVRHKYGPQMLIRKDKIEKIFENEILSHMKSPKEDFDESKTDITTTSGATNKISNFDKYRSAGGKSTGDVIQENSGLKEKLLMRHNERLDQNPVKVTNGCGLGTSCDPLINGEPDYGEDVVLHLKVPAKFVDFYEKKYLKMFPDSSLLKGIRNSKQKVPIKRGSMLGQISENGIPALVPSSSGESGSLNSKDIGDSIQLESDGSLFMNLAVEGSLGLLNEYDVSTKSRNKTQLVLVNRTTSKPVAVCILKSPYGPPVVHIYAPKPIVQGQAPSNAVAHKDNPMYSWAEFTVEGQYPLPVRYAISMATGNGTFEKTPSYKGNHVDVGMPNIQMVGRTESESAYSGCCLLTLKASSGIYDKHRYYSLMISRGTDPALFICLSSIVDEMLDSTMKHQYKSQEKKLKRSERLKRKE